MIAAGIVNANGASSYSDFSKVIEIKPKAGAAYADRCVVYLRLNKNDRALSDCTKAIELGAPKHYVFYNRGLANFSLNKNSDSLSDFTKAINKHPDKAEFYAKRCAVYWRIKKQHNAVDDCTKAIELNPNNSEVYVARGKIYVDNFEYDKGIADYEKAISIDPINSLAYNNLAWIRATAKDAFYRDGREAVIQARKAISLAEVNPPGYLDTLAAAYAENNQFDKAAKTQQEAVDILNERKLYNLANEYRKALIDYKQRRKHY